MVEGAGGTTQELWQTWEAHGTRLTWQTALARGADPEVVAGALAEVPAVSAVEALAANRELVERLIGQRWFVMQAAREEGASWSQIGAALGMSKQGAQDWYRRKIALRAELVPEFHDAERAQAVLADEPEPT